jgi:hypothetical protein
MEGEKEATKMRDEKESTANFSEDKDEDDKSAEEKTSEEEEEVSL